MKTSTAAAKRGLDFLGALLGLALGLPLLLLAGVWVRLDSPGPALFTQVRVGRRGRLFKIYKFRTMHVQPVPTGPEVTASDDARITRAGRWLRRSKLDELPQLFNVLKGEMSLVGPRPEVPRYMAMYSSDVRERILSVRPGMTDRAAIAFRDEERILAASADPESTYIECIMPAKQAHYLEYVATCSVGQDLRILLDTVRALLRRSRPECS